MEKRGENDGRERGKQPRGKEENHDPRGRRVRG